MRPAKEVAAEVMDEEGYFDENSDETLEDYLTRAIEADRAAVRAEVIEECREAIRSAVWALEGCADTIHATTARDAKKQIFADLDSLKTATPSREEEK